jgi:gamma-glutamyltranspeptidase / glutathione hydrolase
MQTFTIRKPAVTTQGGLVAAQNRRAAEAGAGVLRRGGNAMDAAIVTALVLSVVEPWLSGIGGGGFLIHADGQSGEVDTLDFHVRSPAGLDPTGYRLSGGSGNWFNWPIVEGNLNVEGYASICVPGAVAGFAEALERFGTISFAEALAPAIEHAERGLEIDWYASLCIAIECAGLAKYPASAEVFLDHGRAPRSGTGEPHMRPMPTKAKSLKRLARAGARDFYEGEVARLIVNDLAAGGSRIGLEDLAEYKPEWGKPLCASYRDFEINAVAGLSGGPSFIEASGYLMASGLSSGTSMADAALIYAGAVRQAYQTRLGRMGHAARPDAGCTSHVSVVDANGSMVALTNTLLSRFGSQVTLPNAGMLMNNGMMWFDPRPGEPNAIAPGVKPLANVCPLILKQGGAPRLAIGAAGGRTIFPALLQIVSYLVDFGLSLEEAFHRPRIEASTPVIKVNAAADPDVAATVGAKFPVEIVEDTLYPVNFAVPSAAWHGAAGENIGMAHPTSPWAAVAVEVLPS